ncbi:hypothetical protein [Luteibacter yeojuensis]|uniref:Uncharacterized protein n=1 Tax=Luteibacter yeojuensis TaxID=345309 RepID=A0A0F3KLL3_9GAMM|nr:hypothetical protein [Luteibacter yeojuensis]KJV31882.1 hypothetical protein VI08_12910 [Luteibacter yeojuensis]
MLSASTVHAVPVKQRIPRVSSPPLQKFRHRRLAQDPSILSYLAQPAGALGTHIQALDFRHAPFNLIPAGGVRAFGEMIIIAGESTLRVGCPDNEEGDRCVLTGVRGRHNDCMILFRHAYGTVTCRLGVGAITADAHIGFLQHGDFAEVRTFSFTRPREAGAQGDAGFWTTLQYSARHLNELQGMVWRGGTLCIESLVLEP